MTAWTLHLAQTAAPQAVPLDATRLLTTGAATIGALVVLTAVLLLARRWLLGPPAPSKAGHDLAEVLRDLKARGEITPEQLARASQRLWEPAAPSATAKPRDPGMQGKNGGSIDRASGPHRLSGTDKPIS